MFTRIVVPLDGSEESLAALRTAYALAARTGATLGLLHVIERARPQAAVSQAERGAARRWLRQAAHSVQTDDEPVTIAVRSGQPAATILAYARESEADLICMATHARAGLQRLILGSVAEQVLHDAPVPVLLVRSDKAAEFPATMPVVVPLDGSARAEAALPYARTLAAALEAPLTLVRVSNVATPVVPTGPYTGEMEELLHDEMHAATDEAITGYLEGMARSIPDTVTVRTIHLRGTATERLVTFLRETRPALVVMGAHGRSGVARWVMGSVAAALIRAAVAPVLLVGDAFQREERESRARLGGEYTSPVMGANSTST